MTNRCASCGFCWPQPDFFRQEQGGLFGLPMTVCEACSAYKPTAYERGSAWTLASVLLAWFPLYIAQFRNNFAGGLALLAVIASAVGTTPLRIFAHELGHAFPAKALGEEVVLVTVGSGPLLARGRLLGMYCEFRRYWCAGGRTKHFRLAGLPPRWRRAIVVLGGPMANVLLAVVAISAAVQIGATGHVVLGLLAALLLGFGIAEALTAAANLVPRNLGEHRALVSDGKALLKLLLTPNADSDFYQIQTVYALNDAGQFEEAARAGMAAAESRFAAHGYIQAMHAISRSRGDEAALDWFLDRRQEIEDAANADTAEAREARPWLQMNISWCALKCGRGRDSSEYEQLSRSAMDSLPDAIEALGTRGAWLTESGDPESGLPLLIRAVRYATDRRDRADFCRFLSYGWKAKGDAERAKAYHQLRARFLEARSGETPYQRTAPRSNIDSAPA